MIPAKVAKKLSKSLLKHLEIQEAIQLIDDINNIHGLRNSFKMIFDDTRPFIEKGVNKNVGSKVGSESNS